MSFPSRAAGNAPTTNKKYIVVDRTRYRPDGTVCPSSPPNPWAVYEDTSPLIEPPLAEFPSKSAALAHAVQLGDAPDPT